MRVDTINENDGHYMSKETILREKLYALKVLFTAEETQQNKILRHLQLKISYLRVNIFLLQYIISRDNERGGVKP